jgi:hypothetical protein
MSNEETRIFKKVCLTDQLVAALPPAKVVSRYNVYDTAVPNFSVRVTRSGAKGYMLGQRYPGSKQFTRRIIGRVGEISLDEARAIARSWIKQTNNIKVRDRAPSAVVVPPRNQSQHRKQRFCLYRIYDGHNTLLYIGISRQGIARIRTHCEEKEWADEICRIDLEDCADDEAQARAKERQAIVDERPKYNVVHQTHRMSDNPIVLRRQIAAQQRTIRELSARYRELRKAQRSA